MKELALDRINDNSPYMVELDVSTGLFKFVSDFGVSFSVAFEEYDFLFLPQVVYDEEENENYAALIIRRDNPQFNDLVSEFTNTITLLNGKPD